MRSATRSRTTVARTRNRILRECDISTLLRRPHPCEKAPHMSPVPIHGRRPSVRGLSIKTTLLLAAALILGGATDAFAQTGTISGTVTSSTTGLGLANTEVHFY